MDLEFQFCNKTYADSSKPKKL